RSASWEPPQLTTGEMWATRKPRERISFGPLRKVDRDRGPLAQVAFGLNAAALRDRKRLHRREAQTSAASGRLGRKIGIERVASDIGRHADAGVRHGDDDVRPRPKGRPIDEKSGRLQLEPAPRRHRIAG